MEMTVDGKPVEGIVGYLQAIVTMKEKFCNHAPEGYYYKSMEAFILAQGKHYTPKPLPKGIRIGQKKDCFKNAFNLANDNPGYTYVEGYASSKTVCMPLEHAWVVDLDGNVIDNTWEDGDEYFGVPFKTDYVRRTILDKKTYGVIENWEQKFPLMKVRKAHGIKG